MLDKESKYYLIEIIYTISFLIISTCYWFNYQKSTINYQAENITISKQISFNYLKQINDKNINELENYSFNIKNESLETKEIKIYVVSNLSSKTISNNYIKYQINNSNINNLNMDGIIYIDNFNSLESKNFTLKLWISDNYKGNLNYDGKIVIG